VKDGVKEKEEEEKTKEKREEMRSGLLNETDLFYSFTLYRQGAFPTLHLFGAGRLYHFPGSSVYCTIILRLVAAGITGVSLNVYRDLRAAALIVGC
jgi:hypothetical protein